MSTPVQIEKNIYQGELNPETGSLGGLLKEFGADIIIGHPTYECAENIKSQLKIGIEGAVDVFEGKKVAFVVTDSTYSEKSGAKGDIEAALETGKNTIASLPDDKKDNVLVFAGPYEGYGGDATPGKGSALKMVFEEFMKTDAQTLILLDGDLRNDMKEWQGVYKRVISSHEKEFPGKNYFITARYARHFVDASLTRKVVGPLTTLIGKYVPGGISGDIVLSRGAVELETITEWNDARRRYGTDISTTFDNIAHDTVIYEVYLGAKLHDVTNDAKLSVMPGEVIGAALERILYYEKKDGRVSKLMGEDKPLDTVVPWGPDKTGISFIDPGETDVFNIDAKRASLLDKFNDFLPFMEKVLRPETLQIVKDNYAKLSEAAKAGQDDPLFMNISEKDWINILYEAVGYIIATEDLDNAKRALNYLYTAAFLEFCKLKLYELGLKTVEQIKGAQSTLGVDAAKAEPFYNEQVDDVVKNMAMDFYNGRAAILDRIKELKGSRLATEAQRSYQSNS
ncbi:MAG: hypothetical protein GDA48_10225 [Hormoscilla sp. GM102CHS1]|nr:hypothetical protein [Hormoscilla sp. GM102CHS1]